MSLHRPFRTAATLAAGAALALLAGCGTGDAFNEGFDRGMGDASDRAEQLDGADPGDIEACERVGMTISDWNDAARGLGSGTSIADFAQASDLAMSAMSEAAVDATDTDVESAAQDLTGIYEEAAASARRLDMTAMQDISDRGATAISDVISACNSATGEDPPIREAG